MARTISNNGASYSNALVSAAVVVAGLYFGRPILLPFALAILLSFLLAPLVERFERWRFGRIAAVLSVVSAAFLGLVVLGSVLAHQVYDLAYKLPNYKENILAKAETFRSDGTGVLDRVSQAIEEMRAKLSAGPPAKSRGGQKAAASEAPKGNDGDDKSGNQDPAPLGARRGASKTPVPVKVVETLTAKEIAQGVLGPLLGPFASAAMVVVFVIFMLLRREDLRNRFIYLIGGEQLNLTTNALDDAAERVSRYLLMQAIINSAYGLVICVGLFVIGLPNALLWGVMTAVLRFVPYIGPWIAALMPITISLAVFDGWTQPLLVLVLFVVNELVSNNFIEPWLYGSSTGISTIGILASAVFWTWIWGPIGLVMATPLTVCLTVVGRYVPQLSFFNTLLGDHEVLTPAARFYQRLLAMDPEEATEVAEDYLETSTLTDLYDAVLLPALSLAEQDRHHGALDDVKQRFVHQTTREIVEDFGERAVRSESDPRQPSESDAPAPVSADGEGAAILCLPARDEADEIAGIMLAQLLSQRGLNASVASTGILSSEKIEKVGADSAPIVCVSALPPFAATHARYLAKRLRPKYPKLKLVVGIWQPGNIAKKSQDRLAKTGIDKLVTTLAEAVTELERMSHHAAADVNAPTPISAAY